MTNPMHVLVVLGASILVGLACLTLIGWQGVKTPTNFVPHPKLQSQIQIVKLAEANVHLFDVELRQGQALAARQLYELRGAVLNFENYDVVAPRLKMVIKDAQNYVIETHYFDLPQDFIAQQDNVMFAHRIYLAHPPHRVQLSIETE